MFWSAAMLAVGGLNFAFQASRDKGTVKVGDDDLVMLLGVGLLFLVTLTPLDLMYSVGVGLWLLGMLLRFDRATVRYIGVNHDTGNVVRGTILLYRDEPMVLSWSGRKPEVCYEGDKTERT